MNKIKVKAWTCYLGQTGFAYHARGFFRELSHHVDLKVVNWTSDNNAHLYLDQLDIKLRTVDADFIPDIEIVLEQPGHDYFTSVLDQNQNPGTSKKIAYTVWESTMLDDEYVATLKRYDQVWVVSAWHKTNLQKQGLSEEKIFVVNEGFNPDLLQVHPHSHGTDKFTMFFSGRWDYRKFVPEILQSFTKEFCNGEDIEFVLQADNPFANDGYSSTEERLKAAGITDPRIKVVHFSSREEYLERMATCNVFVSCARAEGWNIPLMEAMVIGVPAIYCSYGAPMEYCIWAQGTASLRVKPRGMEPANKGIMFGAPNFPGQYCIPGRPELREVMRDAYVNNLEHGIAARMGKHVLRSRFSWPEVVKGAIMALKSLGLEAAVGNDIVVTYLDGPKVDISGEIVRPYQVEFYNNATEELLFRQVIYNKQWAASHKKFYIPWRIVAKDGHTQEILYEEVLNLQDKTVQIIIDTSALGDTIAWVPYAEQFRRKHGCRMTVACSYQDLFEELYPDIVFVPHNVPLNNIDAVYRVGIYNAEPGDVGNRHPRDYRNIPLQQVATDILGLEYEQIRPELISPNTLKRKKVCIAIHSTAQMKYWNNPTGWQDVVNYLVENGYEVVNISKEENGYMGNTNPFNCINKSGAFTLRDRIVDIADCELFIGIASGLSWLAWACSVPVILISGFSNEHTEFHGPDVTRIINKDVCNSCWNNFHFDKGNWGWCPAHSNTDRQFECSKQISSATVIEAVKARLGT